MLIKLQIRSGSTSDIVVQKKLPTLLLIILYYKYKR